MKRFVMFLFGGFISLMGLILFAGCASPAPSDDVDLEAFAVYLSAVERADIAPGDVGAVDMTVHIAMEMDFMGTLMEVNVISRLQTISDGDVLQMQMVQMQEMLGMVSNQRVRLTMDGDEISYISVEVDGRAIDNPMEIMGADILENVLTGTMGAMPRIDEAWLSYASISNVSVNGQGYQTVITLVFDGEAMLADSGEQLAQLGMGAGVSLGEVRGSMVLDADGTPLSTTMEMPMAMDNTESLTRISIIYHAFGDDVVIDGFDN